MVRNILIPSKTRYAAITIAAIGSACQKLKKKFNNIPNRTAADIKKQARVSWASAIIGHYEIRRVH